jgi:DNA-binding IclR family transcriptional regulator
MGQCEDCAFNSVLLVKPKRDSQTIQSIERAIDVLFAFTTEHPEWGVSELAEAVQLHPSTVSRILSTLKKKGIVQKDSSTRTYQLSLRVLDLARTAVSQLDLVKVAHPHMTEFVEEYHESVFVVVLDGIHTVTIGQVIAPRFITSAAYSIGRRSVASAVSGGKVLLAFSPESVIEALLKAGLHQYTPNTIISRDQLVAELAKIRLDGHAIADQELEIGLFAVAAPIFDREGQVIAAVSSSGPRERIAKENLPSFINGVKLTAGGISADLGWPGAGPA